MSVYVNYVRYDVSTGRIDGGGSSTRIHFNPDEVVNGMRELEVPEVLYEARWYVENGLVVEKTDLLASWTSQSVLADGISEIVLSPLPNPCTVFVDNIPTLVEDGSFEFSADDQGEYTVYVDHHKFHAKEWQVIAHG